MGMAEACSNPRFLFKASDACRLLAQEHLQRDLVLFDLPVMGTKNPA
jgi:hypothetical protein